MLIPPSNSVRVDQFSPVHTAAASYFSESPPPRRGISPVFSALRSSDILGKLEKRKSKSVKSIFCLQLSPAVPI